jgi:hypothetical protein
MRSADPYLAERALQMRVDHELRQAEASRLVRQAMKARRGWLSLQARRLACEVGYQLVVLGSRLEPDESSPAPAASK